MKDVVTKMRSLKALRGGLLDLNDIAPIKYFAAGWLEFVELNVFLRFDTFFLITYPMLNGLLFLRVKIPEII